MISSRASEERDLTPSAPLPPTFPVTTNAPAAESASQAILFARTAVQSDARWIAGAALSYAALVLAGALLLNPYFAQTWDVTTFTQASQTMLTPNWAGLYAVSRADQFWPYAYPPLHALVGAPFVALGGEIPAWLLVRIPPLLFDLALGVLLYGIVAARTQRSALARLALIVWLLNPVTWYDTAVQGHFEGEWLFFVALAYWLAEDKRNWIFTALSFSVALLFKQTAAVFVLPYLAALFFEGERVRGREGEKAGGSPSTALRVKEAGARERGGVFVALIPVLRAVVVIAVPLVIVSLPFLLHSNDYWFMNVQYVADVPLQTQSWLVGLAGLFSPDNIVLRLSSILVFGAAGLLSISGARRGKSLWVMGALVTLAFFLLSKKVVGYYYVMLLPFALVALIPTRHFRTLMVIVAATAFISLSPYFASWANQAHWWVYALLGAVNSFLWLALAVRMWKMSEHLSGEKWGARELAFLACALVLSAASAAFLQPLVASTASPIRAPMVAEDLATDGLFAGGAFIVAVGLALGGARWYSRTVARDSRIPWGLYALVVLSSPLYFLTFTLTKESTALLEFLLGS